MAAEAATGQQQETTGRTGMSPDAPVQLSHSSGQCSTQTAMSSGGLLDVSTEVWRLTDTGNAMQSPVSTSAPSEGRIANVFCTVSTVRRIEHSCMRLLQILVRITTGLECDVSLWVWLDAGRGLYRIRTGVCQ